MQQPFDDPHLRLGHGDEVLLLPVVPEEHQQGEELVAVDDLNHAVKLEAYLFAGRDFLGPVHVNGHLAHLELNVIADHGLCD